MTLLLPTLRRFRKQHVRLHAVFVFTLSLLSAMPPAVFAGDVLRPNGGGGTGSISPTVVAPGVDPVATAQALAAGRAAAGDVLARASHSAQALQAMQEAARALAISGANNLGANPNNPSQQLPNVPNGLAVGGLQVDPAVATNAALWSGANAPTQAVDAASGHTTVNVTQTAQQALLTWRTFNIGKDTTLNYDQSAGGANAGQWIAFNYVTDPSTAPSQILGSIQAQGQVYVINQNGIIFGGSSYVNVHTLVASSLPINSNLVNQGLLNNPDAQFLFTALALPQGGDGTPSYTPPAAPASGRIGDVTVQAGAKIEVPTSDSNVGGRVMLVGPNVTNNGSISTPDGQTILAAGLQVGFTPHSTSDASLRGLDVYVGAVVNPASLIPPYAGTATNNGVINTPRGNTTITGKEVVQNGAINSSTSVALNGRVDLLANYAAISNTNAQTKAANPFLFNTAGHVRLGANSVIQILPEWSSTETITGTELALRSQVNIQGLTAYFGQNSVLLAPNALVSVKAGVWDYVAGTPPQSYFVYSGGQIYLDTGATISVAGSTDVNVPVTQNLITLELRAAELADSPLQRNGVLRGQTITVDIRETGVYNGKTWVGTPLADISGYVGLIQRTVSQLTVAGGTVDLHSGGSVVMQSGAQVDTSAGWINYTGGDVLTTKVITGGYIIDISRATPNLVYDGIYTASTSLRDLTWAVSTTFVNNLAPGTSYYDPGNLQGAAGGKLNITAASAALDGLFVGRTVQGPAQREVGPSLAEFSLKFQAQRFQRPAYLIYSPTPPRVTFASGVSQPAAAAFALDSSGAPLALSAARLADVYLSPSLFTDSGFGIVTVENAAGNIIVPAEVTLAAALRGHITLVGANLDVFGTLSAPGGEINLTALNITPQQRVDLQALGTLAVEPAPNAGRGVIRLAATTRLSTAGTVSDDRIRPEGSWLPAYVSTGGSISLRGYTLDLVAGSVLDVSGGLHMSGTGVAQFGDAGSLLLHAGQDPELQYITGGSFTHFASTLLGYSGAQGGSLSLLAPLVQVGGTALNAASLLLQPEFLTQGGFAHYTLAGLGLPSGVSGQSLPAVYIAAGVTLAPVTDSLVLDDPQTLATSILRQPVGVRPAASLTLEADGVNGIVGLKQRGDIVLEAGAVISTDPTGSVTLHGNTVAVLGSIYTPGGHINIQGADDSSVLFGNLTEALSTVYIGSSAVLSAVGTRLLLPDAFSRRIGQVLSGGEISVKGNIIAAAGAVLDVSGASGVLDLALPSTHPLATYQVPTNSGLTAPVYNVSAVPVTVDSNGGRIVLSGSQLLASDATLRGFAGGATALGGTLSVSSGRFYLPDVPQPLLETNLIVTQAGPVVTSAFPADATAIGRALRGVGGSALISRGYFAANSFNNSGMDSLVLGGKVEFQGATNITARGSVELGRVGILVANAPVNIQAAAVAVGTEFATPQLPEDAVKQVPFTNVPPSTGSGSLNITASHVEVGSLALQGIRSLSLTATQGDIVGAGVLTAAGHITLTAGQIYAPSATSFTVAAYDYVSGGSPTAGSITTQLSGGPRSLPLSAGSTLNLFASTIEHGGALLAPFGTIRLGWDGTGTAPRELLTGSTLAFPVTTQLTLAAGSTTSVSAIDPITGQGVIIPYGVSLDGSSWLDPRGVDITTSGPPEKQIILNGVRITTQVGSTLDLRGGGDLMAWRWVQGNGGSRDILDTDGSFAIVPGYLSSFVLNAPFNSTVTSTLGNANPILAAGAGYLNETLEVGDRIYLAGSANLAAGVYTLLPARYALLPGAVLVTPKSSDAALGVREVAGNISLVSGYRFNELNTVRTVPTLASRFEVVGQGVINARSDYDLFYANSFFPQAATRLSTTVSRLPQDSGYLLLQATQSMVLNGGVVSTPLSASGRGAAIDITAPLNILITADGSGGSSGVMALSAQALSAFNAESLLVGGRRVRENGVINVTVQSTNLTVANAGTQLVGHDITLATLGALTIGAGTQVVSTGTTVGADVFNINGNGALLRVSQSVSAGITRSGLTTAAGPILAINAGAQIAGANVIFDSTAAITLDALANISGGRYTISSGRISLLLDSPGVLQPSPGLVVTSSFLSSLQSATALSLQSYSALDVYGQGTFGGAGLATLTLSAAQVRGFNQGGGTVRFVAGEIVLSNPSNGSALGLDSAATGSLSLEAGILRLDSGQVALDQFSSTSLAATARVVGEGVGGLTVQGGLSLTTPIITGATGAVRSITASGNLSLNASASPAGAAGGLGSTLSMTGANLAVNTNIRLPSGSLTLRSTVGDLSVNSVVDVSGTAQTIYDVVRYTDAGEIILSSDAANVSLGSSGVLNVAAHAGGCNAGRLSVSVPAGSFINQGTLRGSAGTGGLEGSFELDTLALASLSNLAATLTAASFTQSQIFRVRSGNVTVDGTNRAGLFRLGADQGSITVTGTVNSSGNTGGSIYLSANGSVIVSSGATLTVAAQNFNNAGKGGDIKLEAGATWNGVAGTGVVDVRTGSTLNLSVASKVAAGETTTGSSASKGQYSGTLHLRAPQNSTFNDVLVNPINGTIVDASSIIVEGFRVYDLTSSGGVITSTVQSSIRTNSQSFLGTAGTTTTNYTNMTTRLLANNSGLSSVFILAPGAEIVNTNGGLTLGAVNSNTSSDWDLSGFRFGAKSAPGVLTLRATGSITFYNALSDSFTPTLANTDPTWLWLARTTTSNSLLPVNAQSWSYRLVAGADLAAADFRQVKPLSSFSSGAGSFVLGKSGGTMVATGADSAVTSAVIGATLSNGGRGLFQVVRTGSGSIDIVAGGGVQLANQFAAIYTAGTRVTDPTLGGTFGVPALNQTLGVDVLGAAQQNFPALYGLAGGSVLVSAGGNIERTGANSSRQLPNNWLYRRGYVNPSTGAFDLTGNGAAIGSTTWWVDFSNFFQGVGALAGGNVTLQAGGNIVNVDAVAPTNGRVSAGTTANPLAANQTLLELGGGDVSVRAGGNIDAGVYYVERGLGTLWAGGQITTNATRSPAVLSTVSGANGILNANTWLPTTLFVGKGGFNVSARGDLLLGPVANAFLLPQGINNSFWFKTWFSTYAANSFVNASSQAGSVTLRESAYVQGAVRPMLEAWISTQQFKNISSSAYYQPWLRLVESSITPFTTLVSLQPPTLRVTSFSKDIQVAGNLTLFPAPQGTLELLASGFVTGLRPLGQDPNTSLIVWGASSINVSDALPASIPGVFNPFAYQAVPTIGREANRANTTFDALQFLNFIDILFAESGATLGAQAVLKLRQARHSAGLLHTGDTSPVRIYASGGDLSGLTLYTPKAARLLAARDVTDVAFYLQNIASQDVSTIAAGRDVIAYNAASVLRTAANSTGNIVLRTSASGTAAPLAGDLQISGPGSLQVFAGRNLDLGSGARNEAQGLSLGITSVGNARNPYLGFLGADIVAGAGIGFASSLAASQAAFSNFIHAYVLGPEGAGYLAQVGVAGLTPTVFSALPEEQQRRIALEVFYLLLRDAGREVNRVGSSGYDLGYAAIQSLFPGSTWQGSVTTQFRDIRTKNGGDIQLFAPGGALSLAASVPTGTTPGVVTEAGGNISVFTQGNVNLGIARIFTLKGGDIVIWSSDGDIAAGSSSKTVQAAPPTRVLIDPQSADVATDLAGLATGGGIGVLAAVKGVPPGSVDLIAPKGVVDAGDAGIRATGNLNIAATQVLNASNISAGGTTSGAPAASVSVPNMGAVSSAAAAGAATSAVASNAQQSAQGQPAPTQQKLPSIITIEVLGYGGGEGEDEEERQRDAE